MGYIFETEIGQFMHTVRARTIGEADTITLRGILSSRIPPAIKAYFKAEVERHLQKERQNEVRSKRFPYSIPEVVGLQRQEDLLLMFNYQFDQGEFDTLVDQAVHFTFNFLCRPQFTLVEFLFENQRRMSTTSIEQKLSYCADYEYYTILLKRYFTEHGLAEISYEEFKELLRKIDHEVVSRHSSLELAAMTRSIIGFVEAAQDHPPGTPKRRSLPINAAVVFFEDKGLAEIKLRLEYERDHHQSLEIDITRLAEIIGEVRAITEQRPIGNDGSGETLPDASPSPQYSEPVAVQKPGAEDPDSKESIETGGNGQAASGISAEVNNAPESGIGQAESGILDLPDVHSLFSESEQKKLVKTIFHKDEDDFRLTLGMLGRATTWEEASLILDDLFVARGIDPQSKAAILMTEKIFGRFQSRAD